MEEHNVSYLIDLGTETVFVQSLSSPNKLDFAVSKIALVVVAFSKGKWVVYGPVMDFHRLEHMRCSDPKSECRSWSRWRLQVERFDDMQSNTKEGFFTHVFATTTAISHEYPVTIEEKILKVNNFLVCYRIVRLVNFRSRPSLGLLGTLK